MAVLSGIEPKSVFKYFEEISAIPRGSGNTKGISDYCVRFAEEHGLRCIQDKMNNVIIFKDATPGYEKAAAVMIQGHLDMVCEKEANCPIDFEKDGLTLKYEDGVISAVGTTLGGDDGIAVAMALALLDAADIPHPPLEVVLTVDEETGMYGAAEIDCSPLKSRIMLNLDSEVEGVLLVSCAGGVMATCRLPLTRENATGTKAVLRVHGLTGGHSGVEIDKGRANSNMLMGRLLNELDKLMPISIFSVDGGLKDNAIPRETVAELIVDATDLAELKAAVAKYEKIFAAEYRVADPDLKVELTMGGVGSSKVLDPASKDRIIAALVNLPGGIQRMSLDIPGLVQTSLNMGILKTTDSEMTMGFAVRSSVGTEKEELLSRLGSMMKLLGGKVECAGDYPAWEYRPDSRLRDVMVKAFEDLYGRSPSVEAIHAGVECGLFAGKIQGLDCVSMGPNMKDIHTPNESMEVASVRRTWAYVLEILTRLR